MVKAIELNKRIVDAGVFQPGTTGTSGRPAPTALLHREGRHATSPDPGRPQGFVQNASKEFVKKYKVMKTPALAAGAKHWTANQAGAGWAVSETSKNKDAALAFIKFLYDPANYSPTMNNSNSMPATKSAADKIENPIMTQMTSWLTWAARAARTSRSATAPSPPVTRCSQIFEGKGDPAAVAKEMQAAVLNAKG